MTRRSQPRNPQITRIPERGEDNPSEPRYSVSRFSPSGRIGLSAAHAAECGGASRGPRRRRRSSRCVPEASGRRGQAVRPRQRLGLLRGLRLRLDQRFDRRSSPAWWKYSSSAISNRFQTGGDGVLRSSVIMTVKRPEHRGCSRIRPSSACDSRRGARSCDTPANPIRRPWAARNGTRRWRNARVPGRRRPSTVFHERGFTLLAQRLRVIPVAVTVQQDDLVFRQVFLRQLLDIIGDVHLDPRIQLQRLRDARRRLPSCAICALHLPANSKTRMFSPRPTIRSAGGTISSWRVISFASTPFSGHVGTSRRPRDRVEHQLAEVVASSSCRRSGRRWCRSRCPPPTLRSTHATMSPSGLAALQMRGPVRIAVSSALVAWGRKRRL